MTMQSPVAWKLQELKPDHPAPRRFFPAPTLIPLVLLLWRLGREEERAPSIHCLQIVISLVTLKALTISSPMQGGVRSGGS